MELTQDVVIKRYKQYVSEHMEQVSHMEQIVMNILDRNYDLLYDYFCNALERKEAYKILRARRCQVLFLIFLPVILKNEPDIQIHGTFISSHAVGKYRKDIERSSAVILDDIVIHGRGLQELYESLAAGFEDVNMHAYIHKMDRNADAMTDKLKRKLEFDSRVFDWEWRELSTQLVNVIQATATPYVSFVETYITSQCIDLERIRDGFIVEDNTNEDQKRVGTKAFIIFEKEELPNIVQNSGYDACLRYYESPKMGKAVFAPYVFVKTLSENDIKFFCDTFAEKLSDKDNALRQELLVKQDCDLELKYKAYLVNAILNRIYALYLENKYPGVFDFSNAEWSTLAMCFGNAVADDIEKLVYSDIRDLVDLEFCQTLCGEEGKKDSVLVEGLREALEEQSGDEVLPLYFYYNRQLDEESVKRKEKRKKGLTIKIFYKELGDDVHNSSRLQLKSWDSGIAACDMFVVDHKFVSSYARAGEQSFRYIVDKLDELGDGVNTIMEEHKGEPGSDKEKLGNRLLKQFMENNGENLYEWKTPQIYC